MAQNGTVLTWTRGGGSDNYGGVGNWSGGSGNDVPVNNGTNLFSAIIGDGSTVQLDTSTPSILNLQDFTLGNSTFIVGLNRTFRVLDDAIINGWVRVDGPGTFQATGTSCTLNPYSRFGVTNGGRITLGATSWNTYVHAYSDLTNSLATASGVGSQFNATSVATLVFGGSSFGRDAFDLTATQGGIINLSGLQTIANAGGEDDYLSINVSTGGSMNLSSLNAINMTGGNDNTTVEFNIGAGISQSLPSLANADRLRINLDAGSSFSAPNLTRLTKSAIAVSAGRTVTTGTLTNIDNTRISVADGISFGSIAPGTAVASVYYWAGDYDLYSATGAGSTLNLSGISSLVIGTNTGQNTVNIAARNGGVINLSGLTTIGVYSGQDETINFEITGAGSSINLNSLSTITGNGNTNDRTRFTIGAGRSLNLPALTSAARVDFNLASGATLTAPNLVTLTQTTLNISAAAPFTFGNITDFDGTRILAAGGATVSGFADTDYVMAYYYGGNFTMLSATGVGTQLNLPGVQRIRYATNTGSNIMAVEAVDGGTINLSGVTNVSNLDGQDDTLNFLTAGTGSAINLVNLATITNNNNGRTRFTVGGGTSMSVPALTSATGFEVQLSPGGTFTAPALATLNTASLTLGTGSTLSLPAVTTANGLALNLAASASLSMASISSITSGSFTLGAGSTLNMPSLTTLNNTTLSLSTGYNVAFGPLSNINGTRILISGGKVFGGVTATAYTNNYIYNNFAYDMFAATGAGSQLNLPSITSIQTAQSGGNSMKIAARDGGSVNLSGLTTVTSYPGEDDYLHFEVLGAGSSMNLTGLTTITMPGNGNDRVNFAADSGYAFNLPALTNASKLLWNLTGGSSFSAPNLSTLTETLLEPNPTWGVNTGLLSNFDRSAIRVSAGLNYNRVTATSWAYQTPNNYYGNDFDLFTATGAGSVLNLSSVQTMNYATHYGRTLMTIAARSGGVVNMSGLRTIAITNGEDDVLRINTDNGTINLASLANITIGNGNDNARVQFNVGTGQTQSLPSLLTVARTDFSVGDGATLTAPLLNTISNGTVNLSAGRTVNLPSLASVDRFNYTLAAGSALNMPALTSVTASTWNITPGYTLTTGSITNMDNSRFLVTGGAVFGGQLADPTYNIIYYYNSANYDILAATGAGSQLNASGIQNITYGISGQNQYTIAARDGGSVNLSGLRSINIQPGEDDTLNFELTGVGSSMNLNSLQSIALNGNRNDRVLFTVGAGNTMNLPALTSGQRVAFNVAVGGTLNAPGMTTLQQSNLQISATTGTLNIGTLSNIDQTIIGVADGRTFSNVSAVNVATQYYWRGSYNLYAADGPGSTLSLNSVRSLSFQTDSGRDTVGIRATNGGQINMTGLRDISTVYFYDDDELAFSARDVGSLLRLGPITNVNSASYYRSQSVSFTASLGGRIEFADLSLPAQSSALIADVNSSMSITRSLQFRGGLLSVAPGATLEVGKHIYNYATNETGWVMQQAIINFTAPGLHFYESAGLDLGPVNPGNNGNFGIGRLVLGSSNAVSQMQMLDLFDNANRGANLGEALYIYGLGQGTAFDALQLNNGSTLYLDNISVYVRENGNWIWLNSLFGANQTVVAWGNGYLHLPTPGAAAMLGLAGLFAARRRR